MVRLECNCQICQTNAAKIGKTAPLAALVPVKLASTVKKPHGLVYDAHNPDAMGVAMRRVTGIQAV